LWLDARFDQSFLDEAYAPAALIKHPAKSLTGKKPFMAPPVRLQLIMLPYRPTHMNKGTEILQINIYNPLLEKVFSKT